MDTERKKPLVLQIEEGVSDIPGWTPIDQLFALYLLALNSGLQSDGDILELGSWCGRSSVVLGMASKSTGNSKVHCIDLFPEKEDWYENADGSYSFLVTINGEARGGYSEQTVWKEPFLKDIVPVYRRWSGTLEAFKYHVQKAGLEDVVIPFRGTLEDFIIKSESQPQVRMAFIDGDHSYKAVCEDITFVEQMLVPGGWICFDDAFSAYAGVNKAIEERIIQSGKYDYFQQVTRKLFIARKI